MVHLDTRRIKALGWIPAIAIETGIRSTVRHLLENPWLLERR
jgi:dTDP-D-glucose 4,6-dehydratase